MSGIRIWETAGFVLIAAALHVSAAAVMLPETLRRGEALDAPSAALTAGSPDLAALVESWDTAPDAGTDVASPRLTDRPDDAPEPAPPEIAVPEIAAPAMAAPDEVSAPPNLPPPPEAQPRIVPPQLPELRSSDPPVTHTPSALALDASARPEQRPLRSQPQVAQPRRQPDAQPQPRQVAAPPRRGEAGQAAPRTAPAGGGGMSASQRASLAAQWQAQVSACLMRSIARTSGGAGLRGTLSIRIGRNGRVQEAQVTGSTGNARVDREIARGAQRARCPAAPAGLTDASHAFTQPISIR